MRVIHIFGGALAVVALVAVLALGERARTAAREAAATDRSADLAKAAAALLEGATALSLERSVSQVLLALPSGPPEEFLDVITQQRAAAAGAVQRALLFADGVAPARFREDLDRKVEMVRDLRARVDAALELPPGARSAAALDLPYLLKAAIVEFRAAAYLLRPRSAATDTLAEKYATVQSLAWEAREFAGRARTYFAIATATRRAVSETDVTRIEIDHDRGRAAIAAARLILSQAEDAALSAALEDVESAFMAQYHETTRALLAASRNASWDAGGVDYPMAFDAFFAESSAALGAIETLGQVAGERIFVLWTERRRRAQAALTYALTLCAATALIAILAGVGGHRLFVRRLAVVTRALRNAVQGTFYDLKPARFDALEVHDLLLVLDDYREKAEASERAAEQERQEKRRLQRFELFQKDVSRVVAAASSGDFSERLDVGVSSDMDISILSRDLNGVMEAVSLGLEGARSAMSRLAEGDLGVRPHASSHGDFGKLEADIGRCVTSLRALIGDATAVAHEILGASDAFSADARDVLRGAGDQAGALSTAAARLGDARTQVSACADAATDARARSGAATAMVETSLTSATAADAAMARIEEAASRITEILEQIDEISFSTRLLSLNASVEAARAGEAGKGFAVVAAEVRALSDRSSRAAQDVRTLIDGNAAAVREGVGRMAAMRKDLGDAVSRIGSSDTAVSQIVDAMAAQERDVEALAETLRGLNDVTDANTNAAKSSASGAEALAEQARRLTSVLAMFREDAPEIDDAPESKLGDGPALGGATRELWLPGAA